MIVTIKVTDEGEHYFEIPDEYLKGLNQQAGDSAIWTQNADGSFSLVKKESESQQWLQLYKNVRQICPIVCFNDQIGGRL